MIARIALLVSALFGPSAFAEAPLGVLAGEQPGLEAKKLKTLEYDYEVRGPLVFAVKGDEVRLASEDGAADVWVKKAATASVKTFEDLFASDRLGFLTHSWDAKVFASPDPKATYAKREAFRLPNRKLPLPSADHPYVKSRSIEITEKKTVGGALWLKVRLLDTTVCEAPDGKAIAAKHPVHGQPVEGWVPLRNAQRELNIWFHTRGC